MVETSVIILSYNGEKYLKNCIDSLRKQTYKNFEIIVVDNLSKDNSVKIIEENY
ncbi:MAG: glycosyltransferase family 2 protein, partial [Thermoprotei archaeon]